VQRARAKLAAAGLGGCKRPVDHRLLVSAELAQEAQFFQKPIPRLAWIDREVVANVAVVAAALSTAQRSFAAIATHRPPQNSRPSGFTTYATHFATLVASDPETSERELQAWLGHADLRTMERYRHYRPQKTAAERIGRIFVPDQAEAMSDAARLMGDD
jgi:hypothetical protein